MRVLESRRQLDLALEPLGAQPGRKVRRQHLDHDLSIDCHLVSEKDARHSAATELAFDAIPVAKDGRQPFLQLRNFSLPCGRFYVGATPLDLPVQPAVSQAPARVFTSRTSARGH